MKSTNKRQRTTDRSTRAKVARTEPQQDLIELIPSGKMGPYEQMRGVDPEEQVLLLAGVNPNGSGWDPELQAMLLEDRFHFKDFPEFRPNLSPEKILRLGYVQLYVIYKQNLIIGLLAAAIFAPSETIRENISQMFGKNYLLDGSTASILMK